MGDSESEKLCARLTGTVANKAADEFYDEFNLERKAVFAKFFFRDMMQIYHLPGMEDWPKVLITPSATNKQGRPPPKIYLSLVCFRPPGHEFFKAADASIKKRVKLAHAKARDMVTSCFEAKEDRQSIQFAMHNYPTIAIFMCQEQELKRTRPNNKKNQFRKSILDVKDESSLHCLAAVN